MTTQVVYPSLDQVGKREGVPLKVGPHRTYEPMPRIAGNLEVEPGFAAEMPKHRAVGDVRPLTNGVDGNRLVAAASELTRRGAQYLPARVVLS